MCTLEELRNDHEALREALLNLRWVLMDSETQDVVQAKHYLLVRLLSDHIEKEQEVSRPYINRIQMVLKERTLGDEVEPQVVLRDLEVFFPRWRMVSSERIVVHLCRLLDELWQRLDEEERDFFPIFQHAED